MLDRERADFYRCSTRCARSSPTAASPSSCRSAPSTSSRGVVDLLHMCAYMDPTACGGRAAADPRDDGRRRSQEYREKLLDAVVETDEDADGALPEGEELDRPRTSPPR